MAFWHRINQSKLKLLSQQCKRYYFQVSYLPSPNDRGISVLDNHYWYMPKKPTDICSNVRFLAAPVQVKQKKEEPSKNERRLNEQITAQFIRLVTEEGHAVVSRQEALQRARQLKLDLVEVQSSAEPPVCKIMDFHHEMYKKRLAEKDRAKAKAGVSIKKGASKEVRFTPKIEQKDLEMKANTIKRLMESGYRVKCMAVGKGNEGEDENLKELLSRLTPLIEDVALVESGPFVEKRQAYVVVRHVKFGPPKKGHAKKLKVVGDVNKLPAIDAQSDVLPEDNSQQSVSLSRDEILSDADDVPIQMPAENLTAWSVKDSGHDFENVFDFSDQKEGAMGNSMDKETRAARQTVNLPQNGNASSFVHHKPATDFARANTFQSSHPGSSPETENRYKRSEPRSQFPPRANTIQSSHPGISLETVNRYRRSEPGNQFPPPRSTNCQGQATRDTGRPEPQFPYQRRQPPLNLNNVSVGKMKQVAGASEPSQQPAGLGIPGTAAPSYGIFSNPKANPPEKQVVEAGVRKNELNRYGSASNCGPSRSQNFPGSKPDGGNNGQGGFGIFSRPSSSTSPSGTSKPK